MRKRTTRKHRQKAEDRLSCTTWDIKDWLINSGAMSNPVTAAEYHIDEIQTIQITMSRMVISYD